MIEFSDRCEVDIIDLGEEKNSRRECFCRLCMHEIRLCIIEEELTYEHLPMTAESNFIRNNLEHAELLRTDMRVDCAWNGVRQYTTRQDIELRQC